MAPSKSASPSTSGITTDANGTRHIPSSVRPDGSVRKEIKIRPGYRPPEDVEVYKNRTAEAFRNRGKGGVPGAEGLKDEKESEPSTSSSSKNAKRREAKKKAAAAAVNGGANGEKKDEAKDVVEKEKDPEMEREKEAKKLLKKLRQAKELKDKKEQGAALLPEQFEKVIRINELIRQLGLLGFDADGSKKAADTNDNKDET